MEKHNNTLSFQGMGQMIVEFHKYTPELAKGIFENPLFAKLKLEQTGLSEKLDESIYYVLKKMNIVNKNGDMIGLRPKKVIIKDGNEIIPDDINADFIIQKGGEIGGILKGDKVQVSAGSNKGVEAITYKQMLRPNVDGQIKAESVKTFETEMGGKLVTDSLESRGKTIFTNKSSVDVENALLKDESFFNGQLTVGKNLTLSGKAHLSKDSIVGVSKETKLIGNSEVSGSLSTCDLTARNHSVITKTGSVYTQRNCVLKDKFKLDGKIHSFSVNAYDDVVLNQGSCINSGDNVLVHNNSIIGGEINAKRFYGNDSTEFLPISQVNAEAAFFFHNVKLNGTVKSPRIYLTDKVQSNALLDGNLESIELGVKIGKDSKITADGYKSSPLAARLMYRAKGGTVI